MRTTAEALTEGSSRCAILHGPIVLAAPDAEDLDGLFAEPGRGDQVARGPLRPTDCMPVRLSTAAALPPRILPDSAAGPLHFRLKDIIKPPCGQGLLLLPFFRLHEARYQTYWKLAGADGNAP